MKLPNNFGSVTKLSGKRRKPWRVLLPLQTEFVLDPKDKTKSTIKQIRKCLGCYATKQEALKALMEWNDTPKSANCNNPTLESILNEIYSDFADLSDVRKSAYNKARERLSPIYNKYIKDIKLNDIQNICDAVSTPNARNIKNLLNKVFEYAIKYDFCEKNYASFINCGKYQTKKIHKIFSDEEIKVLWKHCEKSEYIKFMLVLCYSGMRYGELLNIKSENVFDNYMIGGNKTKAGKNRVIPLHPKIQPFIRKWQSNKTEYLFSWEHSATNFTHNLHKELVSIGLDNHLSHDGRKTFISNMIKAEIPLITIQKIVGHKSGNITEDIYTEKSVSELYKAVCELK